MPRARTGEGEAIDVSMLEATLVAMGWAVSNWLIAASAEAMGNENMSAAPSGAFRTGRGLLNIAANKQEQFEKLCRLVGREELIGDPRFAGREDRKLNRYELKDELERRSPRAPPREWATRSTPPACRPARSSSVPEILEHPQVGGRELIRRFAETPGVGREVAGGARGLPPGARRPGARLAAARARRRHRGILQGARRPGCRDPALREAGTI